MDGTNTFASILFIEKKIQKLKLYFHTSGQKNHIINVIFSVQKIDVH